MEKVSCADSTNKLLLFLRLSDQAIAGNEHWRWLLVKAFILWRLGDYQELLRVLDEHEELDLDPQTWILRGMAWKSLPDSLGKSVHSYKKAIELAPYSKDAHYNLGNCYASSNYILAYDHYLISLSLDPYQSYCWLNLALLLFNQDQLTKSLQYFRVGLQLNPLDADGWCNYGLALVQSGLPRQAKKCFEVALEIDSGHPKSNSNLGNILVDEMEPSNALNHLEAGSSQDSKARLNLGLCRLLLGDFERGWSDYSARLDSFNPPCIGETLSSLSTLSGPPRSIYIWCEQGLGDSLMFVRYLWILTKFDQRIILLCQPSLQRLFESTFRDLLGSNLLIKQLPSKAPLQLEEHSFHLPLLDLPSLFSTVESSIPSSIPYLEPSSLMKSSLKIELPPGGLSVGIAWASDPANTKLYRHKSVPLDGLMKLLYPLLELDLINIHSLQVGVDSTQLDPWKSHPRVFDWSNRLSDFEDTAHVVRQLDLIISVDTAVCHLSGALGKPTWVLLPANPDWRWLLDRSDSPWYPNTSRLFRQSDPGNWQSVFMQLQVALDNLFLLDLRRLSSCKVPGSIGEQCG